MCLAYCDISISVFLLIKLLFIWRSLLIKGPVSYEVSRADYEINIPEHLFSDHNEVVQVFTVF